MWEFLRQHFAVRIEAEPLEREPIALVSLGRPISSHDLQAALRFCRTESR